MRWLTPLGFLGLIGIAVLILIYIIKPNYQQKYISSSYVWKLSLKYKKKKLPISKWRNVILFMCQLLALSLCATLLAQPFLANEREVPEAEKIVIIDGSGNMLARDDTGETRFERAVEQVKKLAREVSDNNGNFTVILAGKTPTVVVNSAAPNTLSTVDEELARMLSESLDNRYWEPGDVDGAIALANAMLEINPAAEVVLYTATTYLSQGKVDVQNVANPGVEWNAALLSAEDKLEDNFHQFEAQVAVFGKNANILVECEISGVKDRDGNAKTITQELLVQCTEGQTQTVSFPTIDSDVKISNYDHVKFALKAVRDSFEKDNVLYLYGGNRPTLKVQYCSSGANPFIEYSIKALREGMRSRWNIDLTIVREGKAPLLEGFDFYIFEHTMPEVLPTDGAVFLTDLNRVPEGLDIQLLGDSDVSGNFKIVNGAPHEVTAFLHPENIEMTAYQRISVGEGFEKLMYCGGDPVFAVKNTPAQKVAVMTFSLNRSTAAMLVEFPTMMYNLFNYFIPSTLERTLYDIGESVTITPRSGDMTFETPSGRIGEGVEWEFPLSYTPTEPGTYNIKQTIGGSTAGTFAEQFFVKIPVEQSNIFPVEEAPAPIYVQQQFEVQHNDLTVYFAAALLFLLVLEWWLQSRAQQL